MITNSMLNVVENLVSIYYQFMYKTESSVCLLCMKVSFGLVRLYRLKINFVIQFPNFIFALGLAFAACRTYLLTKRYARLLSEP